MGWWVLIEYLVYFSHPNFCWKVAFTFLTPASLLDIVSWFFQMYFSLIAFASVKNELQSICYLKKFLKFQTPFRSTLPSCTCKYTFSLQPLPLITIIKILFFKEDMTEIYFVNYYQSKNRKHRYKIKKLLYKAIVALFSIPELISAGQRKLS